MNAATLDLCSSIANPSPSFSESVMFMLNIMHQSLITTFDSNVLTFWHTNKTIPFGEPPFS